MIRPISAVVAAVAMWALPASAAYLLFPDGNEKTLAGGMKSAYEAYKKGDFAAAVPVFRAEAAKGDKDAQFAMGRIYEEGRTVEASAADGGGDGVVAEGSGWEVAAGVAVIGVDGADGDWDGEECGGGAGVAGAGFGAGGVRGDGSAGADVFGW
jgi:hypothetical protein